MKKLSLVAVVVLSVVMSSSAFAADGGKMGNIGPLAGMTFNVDGGDPIFAWGLTGGYKIADEWTLGGYFSMASQSTSQVFPIIGTVTIDSTFTSVMATFDYNPASMAGFYVGPRLGLTFVSAGVTGGTSASTSEFTIGAGLGYDFAVADSLTVGLQANWHMIMSDPSSNMIAAVVPIKWWF